jgi:hypothetical protein
VLVGNEITLDVGRRRFRFLLLPHHLVDADFTFVGASRVCSFHNKRDFFSSAVTKDRLVGGADHSWLCLHGWRPFVISNVCGQQE